jgi:purine nucleoside phosphorylase
VTKTGFITGTGFYTLPGLTNAHAQELDTPFGQVTIETGNFGDQEVVLFPGMEKNTQFHRKTSITAAIFMQ